MNAGSARYILRGRCRAHGYRSHRYRFLADHAPPHGRSRELLRPCESARAGPLPHPPAAENDVVVRVHDAGLTR